MTGCIGVNWYVEPDAIVGRGNIITKTYTAAEIGEFTGVEVSFPCKLYLYQGDSEEVKIELQESLSEHFSINTSKGYLEIKAKRNIRSGLGEKNTPKVYITYRTLENLNLNGVIEIVESDTINSEWVGLDLAGVVSGKLGFNVEFCSVNMSGVGNLTLTGSADRGVLVSSGTGRLSAFGLVIKDADVSLSGVGAVEVNCTENLYVYLSGLGSVLYKGNPSDITQEKSGLGSITKAD